MQKTINSMEIMVSNIIGISVIIFTGCLEFQPSFINGIIQIKNALDVNVIIFIVLFLYYYYYYCNKCYIIFYCVFCQIQRLSYPQFIDNLFISYTSIRISEIKIKVEFVLKPAMKAQRESRSIALLFLYLRH